MSFKHVMTVLALIVSMGFVVASAEEGIEAAKAGSGSFVGDLNVGGHGLSGPGAVRASLGLKRYGTAFSTPAKKAQAAAVPAPRSAGSSPASQWPTLRSAMTNLAATAVVGAGIGAGIGALVGGPAGAALGAGIGLVTGEVGSFVRFIVKHPPEGGMD